MSYTPFIQNVSRQDIETGNHAPTSADTTVLIQISDTDRDHPTPKAKFKHIYQFSFDDIEQDSNADGNIGITDMHAEDIADIIKKAYQNDYDIIVHCHAGLCRSGGVAQAAEAFGFGSGGRKQVPNLRVKHKVMCALDLVYDSEEVVQFSALRKLLENME